MSAVSRSPLRKLSYVGVVLLFELGLVEVGLRIAKPLLLPPLPLIPHDALRTILCIGDSVTQGVGTDASRDPWPVQLKSRIGAEHRPDVRVLPLGRAGAGVRYLPEVVYPVMATLPSTTHPLALVMLGHNDFLRWEDYELQLAQHPDAVDRPRGAGSPLAVLRLLEWATSGTQRQHYDPSPELLGWFHRGLGTLRDRVRARGGEMWLMTYLVPGAPTPGMNPKLVDVLGYARPGEAVINEEIRRTALLLDVPLIDIEHELPISPDYDPMLFLDHIHLTPAGLTRVAALVHDRLEAQGALGP